MADKKFTLQFDFEGNVAPIKAAVEDFKRSLKDVKLPTNLSTSIEKTLGKLSSEMENFEALTKIGFNNLGDTSKAEKSFGKIITLLNQLQVQSKSITGLDPKKFLPQATIDRVKKFQKAWESVERETNKKDELTKKINAQTEAIEKQRAALKNLKEERDTLAAANKIKGARKGTLVSSQNADKKRRDEVVAEMTALEGEKGGKSSAKYTVLKQELALLGQAINKADREIDALSKDIADNQAKIKTYETSVSNTTNTLQLLEKELADLQNSDITPKGLTELRQELAQITKQNIDQIPIDLKELQQVINGLADDELKEIAKSLNEVRQSANNLPDSAHKGAESLQELVESGRNAAQAANEIENLKNQVLQFFSITNAIQLFKRTVQSALDTVKELDAVMTETAVVTDFTVGDMWEKLPQYSKEASALGASIRDLYSATTLYYQQGLQTDAAMGVGIETMKMARIANMEAADATTAMTAALRGFNMEVNELNAQRVNDVYSELAAITAADTSQIATAMSKTASIAASANMEFETTSALLAQIIETTQEAPETAGTAMKTIIARFTEVKKLFSEGMLTGEDEEGEEININKIDAALKTVGISLKDFLNGSKGIDDIFLELASKWNDLDLATQRYIATTAAGSRQQSRFIAMMSNYERTMELVSAANNSAGASQEQFDKTLESMEAKLQKLKNAWDQFAMGLANNEILKGAVDILTELLNVVNKLTESLSGGNGLAKSIVSLMTVIGALKGGGALLNKGMGFIGEGLGIKIKDTDKKKQTMIDKSSTSQSQTQGKKDGEAYVSGWNRALEQGKKDGFKAGIQGFFGETLTSTPKEKLSFQGNNIAFKQGNTGLLFENFEIDENKVAKIRELNQQLQNNKISFAEAQAQCEQMGIKLLSMSNNVQNGTKVLRAYKIDLQSVGQTSIVVGGALGLLSKLFEDLEMKEAAEAAQKLSAILVTLGTVLNLLGPAFSKLNISISRTGLYFGKAGNEALAAGLKAQLGWWPLIAIFAAVAVAIAGLVAAFIAIRNASPVYQLEKAKEATEEASNAANEAAEAYDNLKSSLESIEEKETALENLTVRTQEWKEAVTELNSEILDLITKYPELAKFVSSSGGILTISDEGKEEVSQSRYEQKNATVAAKVGAQLQEEILQRQLNYNQLDTKLGEYRVNVAGYEDGLSYDDYIKAEINAGISEEEAITKAENSQMLWYDDRKKTEELARAIASSDWEGKEKEIEEIGGINSESFNELKAYGENLLASDTAIKVFTDSLMNAAIINADVSEEYKDSLGGLYDAELINKMIETAKDEIDLTDEKKREDYEKEYAKVMGYQYEDGKFYSGEGENKKEVTVLDQDIKSQLAAIRVQDQLTGNITKLTSVLKTLKTSGSSLDKAFSRVVSKADGAALTLEDLNNINAKESLEKGYEKSVETDQATGEFKEFKDEQLQSLYEKVKDIYPPDEFFRIFSEAYGQAVDRLDQAKTKLSSIGLNDRFKDAKIDTGALSNLADNLYNVFLSSGSKKTAELASRLEGILNGIKDPEQAQIFADALNSIDWKDVDSVKGLSDLLEGMGFNVPIGDIANLEDEIINTAKAAKNFSLEEVRNQLKSLADLKKDLEGREDTDRTFTQEQRDAYIDMNADLVEDFVMVGPDEWVYIGGSMASLEAAIRENTSAILQENTKTLQEKAESSQKWIDLMNSEETYETSKISTRMVGSQEVTTTTDFSGTMNEIVSGILAGEIKDVGIIREILGALGEEVDGSLSVLVDRLSQAFNNNYGLDGTVANANVTNYENWQKAEEQQQYSQMSPVELSGMVQNAEIGNINYAEVITKNQEIISIMEAQARQVGITTEEIEHYKKTLADSGKTGQELEAAALKMAITMRKQQDAINEASKAIGEYLTTMDEAAEGSVDYNTALAKIPAQLEKAFGFEPSMEWVQDNLDLIREWAAGSEDAAAQIWENLSNGFSSAMAECEANVGQSVTTMVDWLNWFSGTEVWASAYMDNSGVINAVAESMSAADELVQFLESIGMETEKIVTYEGVNYPVTTVNPITGETQVDPFGGYMSVPKVTVKWKPTGGFGGGNYNAPSNYTPKSGGGGGGGGGGSSTEWENPYDEFYNTVQKLNEELRKRNKLEREYQKLLDKVNTSADDLTENSKKQLESLEAEKKTREGLLENRKKQMKDIESENSKYSEYAWYNEELGVIEIDWEKINALDGSTDEEFTSGLEEYISQLEDQEKLIEEEEDALDDIYEEVKKIRDKGKDEYFEFEDQVKQALIDSRQKEIDKLSAINDSINDTNARLLDAMQSSIDKYRQDRENERTEEDLSDKQRRLAYLQQDTSGANALEILQLQKEIEEGQEDYTDTLIDQKISELQEQNDKAAEQRERQIQIMEEQLKHYEESGEIWNDVYALIGDGVDATGKLIQGSELVELLKNSDNFEGLSNLGQVDWLAKLEDEVAEGFKWLRVGNSAKALLDSGELKKGQKITFTTKDGKTVTGTLNEDGSVTTSDGKTYKDVYKNYDGNFTTTENYQEPDPPKPTEPTNPTNPETPELTTEIKKGVSAAIWNGGYGWGYDPDRAKRLKEVFGENDIQKNYVNKNVTSGYSGKLSDYSYENMKKKFKIQAGKAGTTSNIAAFKTGGLADFTGPAWLDGTKSRPEYILNADQTKSFFQLVDVLGSLKSGASQSSQITGDSIYDVDINVESIGNDYDVEQLASTIKRMINDDARYRNNNAINLQR